MDCGKIIFARKSNRRSGDVVIRCDVANPIFGHCSPHRLRERQRSPRQLADDVCPKLRGAFRRGLGDRFDRHSRDYRIDHHRPRSDIRLLWNLVGAIHVSPIRETCGRSNQRGRGDWIKVKNPDSPAMMRGTLVNCPAGLGLTPNAGDTGAIAPDWEKAQCHRLWKVSVGNRSKVRPLMKTSPCKSPTGMASRTFS
jgi:hypothetical protein